MSGVIWPESFRLEILRRSHGRRQFDCGHALVNDWLQTKALQHQSKRLSTTKALVDSNGSLVGFYTLATGQVDFSDLPADLSRQLPRRALPVAVVAWLGVSVGNQRQRLGERLFAQALRDCYDAGQTFAFVAVIVDCVDEHARAFYQRWDFESLPGQPFRLFLSSATLSALMRGS